MEPGGIISATQDHRRLGVAQFTDRTESGRYRTKLQPLIAEQLKIPRRNNFVGPSSGNGRWKAVVFSTFSPPFNFSEPLTNFTSSTLDPGPKMMSNSAVAAFGVTLSSLTVLILLSSSLAPA
jgi:hypothetical protein